MDGAALRHRRLRQPIDGTTHHVEQSPPDLLPYRHRDRPAGIHDDGPAGESIRRVHRNGANTILAEMLLHLEDELIIAPLYRQGIENVGNGSGRKFRIHNRTDYLDDFAS